MKGEGTDVVDVLSRALKRGTEPSTVEFKEYVDPDNEKTLHWLLRAIAAMANGETEGFVFVGVKDDTLEVVGLPDEILSKFDNANIYKKASASLSPPPKMDVHRFLYQSKKLVGIVVHPFEQVPTFVSQSFMGHSAGTILIRTPGGESAPAAKESDIRALCDRIIARHAEAVAGLMRRYLRLAAAPVMAPPQEQVRPELQHLAAAREFVSKYWEAGKPCIEVFFAPCSILALELGGLREFRWSYLPTSLHGFPFMSLTGWHGPRLKPQGWIATVPDRSEPSAPVTPDYLWAMHTSWTFLDRDRFWEDDGTPRIVGGLGIMHLATRVCLLLRLLRRIAKRYQLGMDEKFLVGTWLKGVKGRYLASEYATDTASIPRSEEDNVEVSRVIVLSELSEFAEAGFPVPTRVLDIMEEAGWRMGRTDLQIDTYVRAIKHAAAHVEREVLFPMEENVEIYRLGVS